MSEVVQVSLNMSETVLVFVRDCTCGADSLPEVVLIEVKKNIVRGCIRKFEHVRDCICACQRLYEVNRMSYL